jgi:predicted enzyme related to lactoylglutathione lyase
MMNNPVGWFEIYVQDMARAKTFYETVFGLSFTRLDSPGLNIWAFPMDMSTFGASGALVHMPGFSSGANSVIVYFKCSDCAIEAKKAAEAGGSVQKPKTSIGQYGHIALIIDTEGNMVGLHSLQ